MLQLLTAAAPLISAGTGLFGAIKGARQGNAAADAQRDANNVALLNWLQNRRNADQQQQMATAGQINARGDRTTFVPGVGWVATPSTFTSGMQDVADNEAIAGYAVDQPRVRDENRATFRRRLDAGADAESARAGRDLGAQSLEDMQSRLIELGFAEADSGADEVRNAVGVNAIRTDSGGEVAIGNAARNALANRRTALARARAEAPGQFVGARGARINANETAIGAAEQRAAGRANPRLVGGTLDGLNGGAAAELASRFMARGGQVEAPRLGYTDERQGIGIAGVGRATDNLFTELGRFAKRRTQDGDNNVG
jgi:hypothetical protein